ncbi:hypothetical protein AWB73_00091 [Caballeronia turbans]|nr:hypothetical protein AWB73_00091 [Caballeronia turbans]
MSKRQMESLLEAMEMALEALNGEQGKREIRLTKAVLALRIAMLRSDIFNAKLEAA